MAKAVHRMTEDGAATLALEALSFLAAQPEAFERFAGLSGLDPSSVPARAAEAGFLAAVLDFLLADEALLMEFCDGSSTDFRQVHMARHVLGGP